MKVKIPFLGPIRWLNQLFKKIRLKLMDHIRQSLRMQLIITFGFCLVAAIIIAGITGSMLFSNNQKASISYSTSIDDIDRNTKNIADEIKNSDLVQNDEEQMQTLLDTEIYRYNMKVLITDVDGKVLYKSENADENQIDLHSIIRNAMDVRLNREIARRGGEFVSLYPININGRNMYVISRSIPEANIVYIKTNENSFLAAMIGFASFMFLFYFMTKRKMKYIEELAQGLIEISKGELGFRVVKRSEDELGSLAANINFMAEELKNKIERERMVEKAKNELITNISHDLRTPLTSIMGYLKLIIDKKFENEEQLEEYLYISYGKSEKLKVLIEDLFEYTKLSNEGVKLYKTSINLNELIEQLMEELVTVCEENNITFKNEIPKEKIIVSVDAEKIVRVFENILVNAIKYSYKPGEISVGIQDKGSYVVVSVQNKGDRIPNEDLEKLFQRFYRMEKSRSSTDGGSGLGLTIAKSIVDLHGGEIWAECNENDIRFCIKLNKS